MDFSPDSGLIGLALAAFVSATVIPGNSEVVLLAVQSRYPELFWQAIGVATLFNTLGGLTSYLIGRLVPNKAEVRALGWLRKYGAWSLLLSWVPLIGDALCVAAGWLRIHPGRATLWIGLGKLIRYVVIAFGWGWVAASF